MDMDRVGQDAKTLGDVGRGAIGNARAVFLVAALGLVAAVWLSITPTPGAVRPSRPPIAAVSPAALDPSRFILNALLVPALDGDAVPLRWVDPRPALRCGPDAMVRVNGAPLVAGALVPDAPFEVEWQADGCRPFGARGPRFEGRVQLTVFREDWGFSAMVKPARLRVTFAGNKSMLIQPGAASLPQCVETEEPTSCLSTQTGHYHRHENDRILGIQEDLR
jgi:hypothetical protein